MHRKEKDRREQWITGKPEPQRQGGWLVWQRGLVMHVDLSVSSTTDTPSGGVPFQHFNRLCRVVGRRGVGRCYLTAPFLGPCRTLCHPGQLYQGAQIPLFTYQIPTCPAERRSRLCSRGRAISFGLLPTLPLSQCPLTGSPDRTAAPELLVARSILRLAYCV